MPDESNDWWWLVAWGFWNMRNMSYQAIGSVWSKINPGRVWLLLRLHERRWDGFAQVKTFGEIWRELQVDDAGRRTVANWCRQWCSQLLGKGSAVLPASNRSNSYRAVPQGSVVKADQTASRCGDIMGYLHITSCYRCTLYSQKNRSSWAPQKIPSPSKKSRTPPSHPHPLTPCYFHMWKMTWNGPYRILSMTYLMKNIFCFAMLSVSQAHTKATLPPVVIDLAGSILTSPMRISIGDVNAAAPEVEQLLGAPRALGAGHRHKTCRKTNEANMETSYVCRCRKLQ